MSAEIPNPQFETPPHTVLLVLGKNIGEEWTGERIRKTPGHLSNWSEDGVQAAGIALQEGLVDEVVFSITNTAGSQPLTIEERIESKDYSTLGSNRPPKSEAEYQRDKFVQEFPQFADKVSIQKESWDTNTDAKQARIWKEQRMSPQDRLVVMSTGFHIPRVADLFRRAGFKINQDLFMFVTENILALRDPETAKTYRESPLYKREMKKEALVRFIQSLPFAADVITAVTKRSRTR